MREVTANDRAAIASVREVGRSFKTVIDLRLKDGPKKDEVSDYLGVILDTCEQDIRARGAGEMLAHNPPGSCL